jgi:hypothetical protein
MKDFMVFCYLAVQTNALPTSWNWANFLQVAATHVSFAFEESDAEQRWGSENVFAAMSGGRSLRYTGEEIYGSSIQGGESSDVHAEAEERIVGSMPSDAVYEAIGGRAVWDSFLRELSTSTRFRQY